MKMNLIVIVFTVAIAFTAEALPTPSETFMHSMTLDENGDYTLFWKFDDKTITFEAHVRNTGWIGLGLSPNGGMTGSDVVIGWVASDGKAYLKDRYAKGNQMPVIDPHQDWFLISGREEEGFTILKFYRALNTKDCAFDRVINHDTQRVIWSFHSQDPSDENSVVYHGAQNRGSKVVNLLIAAPTQEPLDIATAIRSTFSNPGITVPGNTRTWYHCQVFAMPNVTQKHHVIKYTADFHPESRGIIHHFMAYACYLPNPAQYIGQGFHCFDGSMPFELLLCRFPFAMLAVGGEEFRFPDNVGLPMGGPRDPTLLILETHYDNPELKSGIVDTSGLTLWYTPQLRTHDAGVFVFGSEVSPHLTIPPGVSDFKISGVCQSSCTSQLLPPAGVSVFSTMLHSHLLGRKMRTRHIRDGKEIGDLGRDDQFDFNYQTARVFDPVKVIRPGDAVITECTYDTRARPEVTFGGIETTQEMCISWILYYPKADLNYCFSDVSEDNLLKAVNAPTFSSPIDETQGPFASFANYMNAMRNTTWTRSNIEQLQKVQTQANLSYTCASVEEGKYIPPMKAPFPSNLKFAVDPKPDCFPTVSSAPVHPAGRLSIGMTILSLLVAALLCRLA